MPGTTVEVSHPLLRPGRVAFRGYQANLARICAQKDTLVVLPTGMGKTVVALLVLADAVRGGARRCLLMAPTKPLVEQHGRFFSDLFAEPWSDRVHVLTGSVAPKSRVQAYGQDGLLIATPQVIHNDIVAGRLEPSSLDWIVFDEAHRAVGDYPYTSIGHDVQGGSVRRLGLTASPGHDISKIDEVRKALGLAHVEIRTPDDPDVREYVQDIDATWETLPLPPALGRVSNRLHDALAQRVRQLREMGYLKGAPSRPSRRDLLDLQRTLQKAVQGRTGQDTTAFAALSLMAQAMKLRHAIEQAETQGSAAFVQYMEDLKADAQTSGSSKATRALADDANVNEAYHIARLDTAENPKAGRTGVLVREQFEKDPDSRVIVFTHYRVTCEALAKDLAALPGVKPVVFVGQASRKGSQGLSQKQQAETIARFTAGQHNVLVATSVAEEGLDIPETDLVVFYEPIPSEIRSIQRRGRTGRKRAGRVVVLMTKGTQDEAAHWTARRREQQMVRELHNLRAMLAGRPVDVGAGQTTLGRVPPAPASTPPATSDGPRHGTGGEAAPTTGPGRQVRIVCDSREQAGGVVKHLHQWGATLEMRNLEIGDFVLSDRVVAERKTCKDFVDSLVDGRLFDQLKELRAYPRPFLVLEGESLFGHRQVAPEALMGALASVSVDYGIPVIQTRRAEETARFLHAVAKREQGREGRKMAVRTASSVMGLPERQVYILCGFPGVSEVLARRLLERFGSIGDVLAASEQGLQEVEGVGPEKARSIRHLLEAAYGASA